MQNKPKFKVALVGCGVISGNHLSGLCALENVEVVALCDIDFARAEQRKAEFDLDCHTYTSFDAMLDKEELDAVHIATPHYLHADMAISALKRNINVLLEKPAAISNSELEKIIQAERNSGGRVCICYQNRFNPTTLLAKRIIADDGGAITAQATVMWQRDEKYYRSGDWRGKRSTEGGGVMINQAIHTLDLLCILLGKPIAVTGTCANHHLKGIIDVEDSSEGMIEFDGGKTANFYATTSATHHNTTTLLVSTKERVIEIRNSKFYINGERIDDSSLNTTYYGKPCYGEGHKLLIKAFYDAITTGESMPVPISEATDALRLIFATYASFDKRVTI